MALEYFTLTATLTAVVVDYVDSGADPDLQRISGTVDILPRIPTGSLIWAPGLVPPQGIAVAPIRARFDTDGVLRTIQSNPIDEKQTVTIGGSPTGGDTFTLTFDGYPTTALAYNAPLLTVDAALEALPNVGANNVTVAGTPGVSYVVSFAGALGGADQPMMAATSSWGGGTAVTVTTTRPGTLGGGVKLVANTADIDLDDLYYDLKFSQVVYNKADQEIQPFAILAPTTGGGTVDLASATKFPPKPGL
jgi:hypothetical protein